MELKLGILLTALQRTSRLCGTGVSIRRVLDVHFATHTRYLPHLIGTKTALDQISERFVKLVNTMQNSNNPKVTNIVQVCKNTASSIISMNSDFIIST